MTPDPTDRDKAEIAVGASAAIAGAASVLAWAACCVLPLALSVVGLSFAGAAMLAGLRHTLTPIALLIVAVGWLLHFWRLRRCRTDASCDRPSRLSFWVLVVATALVATAFVWEPLIEPFLMLRLAALR
ncbi:MFS transporter permease [Brevundimonas sp. BAL450]|jgi:mercuric ion transport protein|uniref:hypothetical protein n=1 Tax=Brevundimonas TaxID=41275 RepID=UPI0005ED0E8D|nr:MULTISPECIES: hypothetical protein [Brevundimonas]MBG7616678.1 MFS transporter permease [Brevundimonas sp. BAL450]